MDDVPFYDSEFLASITNDDLVFDALGFNDMDPE